MIRKVLLSTAALLMPILAQAQIKLLRHPTYSKGKVAFSYLGDIWVANENGSGLERLTDNQARDIYPRFSPDGSMIAFSSNREGNNDVYVVPAAGGKPKQLTFHTAEDTVVGWSADGKRIVFSSSRAKGAFPTVATLFEVPVEGGIETPLPVDWGYSGSYAPGGNKLAFMRHPSVWSRKHYRGSYAADLWVYDISAKKYTHLGDADYKGNYLWPMYGRNGEIYFVSDRTANEKNIAYGGPDVMKSVNNIWKISDKGGAPQQVTHHTDGNLFFPSISADGRIIVYEDNFGLWKLDTASGKSTEIVVELKTDAKENDTDLVTITNQAESFHLSPSNRRAAIVAHGELFTIATDRGEPQRVTDTPWREQDPRWSPNGKWIAFVSDRSGRQEVWTSDELGKNPKKLSDVDCDKSQIVWAPDSKTLLWNGSDHKVRRVDVDSGKTDVVATSDVAAIGTPQFSPDGKYISYTKSDNLLRQHVWVKQLETADERMIASDQFQVSSGAHWTPDGKKLLVIGGISVAGIAQTGRGWPSQLYAVAFSHIDKDPNDRDINTEEQAQAALAETAAGGGRGGRGGNGTPANVTVKIEWDGIDRRIKKVVTTPGSIGGVVPSPDSRTYAFQSIGAGVGAPAEDGAGGGPAIYIVHEDGTGLQRLNTAVANEGGRGGRGGRGGGGGFGGGTELQWSRDSRSIYYMAGGGIYSTAVPQAGGDTAGAPAAAATGGGRGGRGGGRGATTAAADTTATGAAPHQIPFSVRLVIDHAAERKQVFEEAWRVMKNRFYDAKMHGTNWAAAKDKYEPLLPHIADLDELHNVVMEMIGEMNASHTGITGGTTLPGQTPAERATTRYPGFTLEPDASGYYKVGSINRNGPADHEYIKIEPGNFLLAVNEKPLKTKDNYWELFKILPGRKFEFLVNSKPSLDGAWTINVEPLTAAQQNNLEYDLWVEGRKRMVEKLTNGEIGYLHIKAMDAPSLEKFRQDLIDNRGKKGLIIDERFNGGGGIDQELLEILNQRKQYQLTRNRDSIDVPRPIQAYFGPMAVLQNERSASDAEMFPDGFRALGLGKVIGVPTMGAVIGTGSFTLLDGSALRTPGSGVYNAKGQNLENYGVPPDVYVDNGPEDFLTGHDRQIEKAIEVLRGEMK
jgi:tricorn protease